MTETATVAIAIPEKWKREVESYEKQRYNVLVPKEIGQIPPFHMPHMSIVQVDAGKDAGETYPLPGGKFGLSKVVLDRIAQAGSITWIPDACQSGWRTPRKYRYFAVGVVKGLDAVRRTIIGEKEIDLDVVDEELRQNLPKRWERMERKPHMGFDQWFKNTLAEESLQFKKHVAARCESGAKNRAIRSAYGLKSSYSAEELKHPFVIPRVVPSFDLSDPETKKMVLADALGIVPELYGKPIEQKQLPPALPSAPDDEPTLPDVDVPEDRGSGEEQLPLADTPADLPPPPDAVLVFEEAYKQESAAGAKEIKEAAIADQIRALESLMVRKGRRADSLKKPLAQFTRSERQGFFEHLQKQADLQAPLPWDNQ